MFTKSYLAHEEHYLQYASGNSNEALAKSWLQNDTVDAWRHQRLYQLLLPILESYPRSNWLTVGDGRYGRDARFIIDNTGNAIATDLADTLLKEAAEEGYIKEFSKENAEALSFDDASFDFVLCKESYHHFPRPMIALYEMLRVAKKGVILIEPNDPYINNNRFIFFPMLKNFIKKIIGFKVERHSYEDSGNYVYKISRREIEKVALGLNYPMIAFKGINDAYFVGVDREKLSSRGPLVKKIKFLIFIQNLLCKLRVVDYGLLAVVIFVQKPEHEKCQLMEGAGYQIVSLPPNPYL